MSDQTTFPSLVETGAASVPDEAEWRREFWRKYAKMQRDFGKGETYSLAARELIRKRIVPEWVFRGLVFSDGEKAIRCEKAVLALERLFRDLFGENANG